MKLKHLILFVILTLFLIGCQPQDDKTTQINFKQGIKELEIDLRNSFLPEKVFSNKPFDFIVTINNNAAYDAKNVKVNLIGLDDTFVFVQSGEQFIDSMDGESTFNPPGLEIVEFNAHTLDLLSDYNDQKYQVHITYDSTLEFTPTVCIGHLSVLSGINDGGCKVPTSPLRFNGQGAPLSVEELEIIPSSNDGIGFRMKLVDRGITAGKVKSITLSQAKLANTPLNCEFRKTSTNKQTIKLDSKGDAELICEGNIQSGSSYTTTLFIELSYDYELQYRKTLRIEK